MGSVFLNLFSFFRSVDLFEANVCIASVFLFSFFFYSNTIVKFLSKQSGGTSIKRQFNFRSVEGNGFCISTFFFVPFIYWEAMFALVLSFCFLFFFLNTIVKFLSKLKTK
jgi:hypothetical protein